MAPPSSLNEGGAGAAGAGTAAARELEHAGATPAAAAAVATSAAAADDALGQPAAIPAGDGKRVSAADIQVSSFSLRFWGRNRTSEMRQRARI